MSLKFKSSKLLLPLIIEDGNMPFKDLFLFAIFMSLNYTIEIELVLKSLVSEDWVKVCVCMFE